MFNMVLIFYFRANYNVLHNTITVSFMSSSHRITIFKTICNLPSLWQLFIQLCLPQLDQVIQNLGRELGGSGWIGLQKKDT